MVEVITIFFFVAALIIIGYLSEILFKKTGIPDVLILIIIGILIAHFLPQIDPNSFSIEAKIFTTFTLVFLLFQGALNIDFRSLFHSFSKSTKLTFISFVLTVLVVSGIGIYILHLSVFSAILIGMILGGTSSAVIIPLVNNINMNSKYKTILTLESAISDVLCIVGTITIIAIISIGAINPSEIVKNILSSFSMAIVIGLLTGIAWIILLTRWRDLEESYMVTIAVIIGLYAFVESPFVEASGAIAALTFGLVLGNSKNIMSSFMILSKGEKDDELAIKSVLSKSAKNFYEEISFFVKVFFFIYLGLVIDFSNLELFIHAGIIVFGIFIIRPFAVLSSFIGEKTDKKSRALMEVLFPKGLAAAVLAQLAVQQGIQGAEYLFSLVLAVVFISIVLCSILAFLVRNNLYNGLFFFLRENQNEHSSKNQKNVELGFKNLELSL